MKRSTMCSIGILIAFFLPWVQGNILFDISGYNIPQYLNKFPHLARFMNTSDNPNIIKVSYFMYLIPICSAINIFNEISGSNSKYSFEFVFGILTALFIFKVAFDYDEEMISNLSIGYYLTVLFSIIGLNSENISVEKSKIMDGIKDAEIASLNNTHLLNQLSILHSLKEKEVLTDEIYIQEKERILNVFKISQAEDLIAENNITQFSLTEETFTLENKKEVLIIDTFNTAEEQEEYQQLFAEKSWFQKNKGWVIGLSIIVLFSATVYYFAFYSNKQDDAVNPVYSETSFIIPDEILGYSFSNYPAKFTSSVKSKLDYSSNRLGKQYKTAITEQYNKGNKNFGGHYIMVLLGAGQGVTLGAIIDMNDGKIYDLPLSYENSYRGTYHNGNNNILYKPNTNLFVCYSSTSNKIDEKKVDLTYSFYSWNDSSMEFNLINTQQITERRIDD